MSLSFAPLESAIRPDEALVTVVAPNPFHLRLDDGRALFISAGTFEAPVAVADHPYSAANGLRRYAPVTAPVAPVAPAQAGGEEPLKRRPGRPRKDAVVPGDPSVSDDSNSDDGDAAP